MSSHSPLEGNSTRLVVTLPLYKDASFLERACDSIEELTPEVADDFVLQIAEDGSNSSHIVDRLRKKYGNILYRQNDQRLGRGKALRQAWGSVQSDVYVFLDVDLATDMTKLDAYRNLIKNQGMYDLVTGSRYIRGAETARPWLRQFSSVAYNSLIRLIFRTGVHDHQCGFKSFSNKLVRVLEQEAKSDSWFWDTEAIVVAKRRHFKVLEIPVCWNERKGNKTPIIRLLRDVWLHGTGLLALAWRVYFGQHLVPSGD
jgi:hypothetical protein